MYIRNAARVMKNLPGRRTVSAVTGSFARKALDPGARHVRRGRPRKASAGAEPEILLALLHIAG